MAAEGGLLSLVLGAVPPIAGLMGKLYLAGSDSRVTRKIEKDAALLKVVPDACKPAIEQLLHDEVQEHLRRRRRKVGWPAVAAMIVIAAITAGVGTALAFAALNWSWLMWFVFGPVTFLGFLLTLIGYGQIFKYPDDEGNYPTRNDGNQPRR